MKPSFPSVLAFLVFLGGLVWFNHWVNREPDGPEEVAPAVERNASVSSSPSSTELAEFLAGKRLSFQLAGEPLGGLVYASDGTFLTSDEEAGYYEARGLFVTLYFPGEEQVMRQVFPSARPQRGEQVKASLYRGSGGPVFSHHWEIVSVEEAGADLSGVPFLPEVERIEYSVADGNLSVTMVDGLRYHHPDVPEDAFRELNASVLPLRHFLTRILPRYPGHVHLPGEED